MSNLLTQANQYSKQINPLEINLARNYYTGSNLLNPNGSQKIISRYGNNTVGTSVSQSALHPYSQVFVNHKNDLVIIIVILLIIILIFKKG